MGAGLVKAAFRAAAVHAVRDHAPVRLLTYMAVTAMDDSPAPAYYGGRDALADALAAPRTAAGYKAVRQALSTLQARGFIELSVRPAPGQSARYRLLDGNGNALAVLRDGAPSDTPDGRKGHPQGAVNSYEQGTLRVGTGHPQALNGAPSDTPRGREEDQEESAPSRFCERHPNGTSTPCGACGEARRAAEAWKPPRKPAPPHVHRFDAVSGYCGGCTLREDAAWT